MSPRARSLLVSGVLFAALFLGGFAGGYVYQHEPARATLDVRIASDSSGEGATPGVRTLGGTVASVEGGRLTLTAASGPVTVPFPAGVAVDELLRAPEGLASGTRVNVGVQSTQYGLVLTGLVAIEGAP